MDIRQTLLDTEMMLKDFVSMLVTEDKGPSWIRNSGLADARLRELELIRSKFQEDQNVMSSEGRLLNFCDFADLSIIIEYHWSKQFEVAFGYLESVKTYFNTLQKFNNPDAYNRPLMSFEKHLILGVTGTLRNNISVYRSWKEVGKEGFPLIETVKDNFGNLWTMGNPKKMRTQLSIAEGDILEFVVIGSDPKDEFLEYRIFPNKWQTGNVLQHEVTRDNVGKDITFPIGIRSTRKYHAYPAGYDDRITFEYTILPVEGEE